MWLKIVFLLIPSATVLQTLTFSAAIFFPPSPKGDTADRHLQTVTDRLIRNSYKPTSRTLNYPFKLSLLQFEAYFSLVSLS